MSRFLNTFTRVLSDVLTLLAVVAMVLMVVHILADVVMRSVFAAPIPGTLEIATHYYLVPITFLCLAHVELRGEHIVVEAFTHFLSQRSQLLLDSLVRVVCIFVLGVFTWRTGLVAIERTRMGEFVEAVYFNLPIWPVRWVLPVSLAAFALAMLVRLLNGGKKLEHAPGEMPALEA